MRKQNGGKLKADDIPRLYDRACRKHAKKFGKPRSSWEELDENKKQELLKCVEDPDYADELMSKFTNGDKEVLVVRPV